MNKVLAQMIKTRDMMFKRISALKTEIDRMDELVDQVVHTKADYEYYDQCYAEFDQLRNLIDPLVDTINTLNKL